MRALLLLSCFFFLARPVSAQQEILLSCFEDDTEICRASGLEAIEIKNWQTTGQYNYFLTVKNLGLETCQVNLAATSSFSALATLEKIDISLWQNQEQIFQASLKEFFEQRLHLGNLAPKASQAYRLIFYLSQFSEEFKIPFDLLFDLACQTSSASAQVGEVLGEETELLEARRSADSVEEGAAALAAPANSLKKLARFLKRASLIAALLFSFLAIFLIIFRSLVFLKEKLLINSRKEALHEKKQSKIVSKTNRRQSAGGNTQPRRF